MSSVSNLTNIFLIINISRSTLVAEQKLFKAGGKIVQDDHGVGKINIKNSKKGMTPSYYEPLEVLLIPEMSGKWPRAAEVRS